MTFLRRYLTEQVSFEKTCFHRALLIRCHIGKGNMTLKFKSAIKLTVKPKNVSYQLMVTILHRMTGTRW